MKEKSQVPQGNPLSQQAVTTRHLASKDVDPSLNSRMMDMILNIENADYMPVRPTIIAESLKIIQSAQSVYERLAWLIYQTPELVINIIRVANSPFYRGVQRIEKVEHALPGSAQKM